MDSKELKMLEDEIRATCRLRDDHERIAAALRIQVLHMVDKHRVDLDPNQLKHIQGVIQECK